MTFVDVGAFGVNFSIVGPPIATNARKLVVSVDAGAACTAARDAGALVHIVSTTFHKPFVTICGPVCTAIVIQQRVKDGASMFVPANTPPIGVAR